MLLYGTGLKAQHNGKNAQLGKRSGSWTTATIRGGKAVNYGCTVWQRQESEGLLSDRVSAQQAEPVRRRLHDTAT